MRTQPEAPEALRESLNKLTFSSPYISKISKFFNRYTSEYFLGIIIATYLNIGACITRSHCGLKVVICQLHNYDRL